MASAYHRLLLVFVDGIGLAPASVHNPLSELPTPGLRRLLGGPLTLEQRQIGDELVLTGIDATLGIEGLPQSATGQTALFTGVNAAERMGRHVTGLPGPRLRAVVESGNLFQRAGEKGLESTFANAYSTAYMEALEKGKRRPSVTTCAVQSAGLSIRLVAELEQNDAVSWDIIRDRFSEHLERPLPQVTAFEAGEHLAAISGRHRITAYETFLTDMAGHGRLGFTPAEAMGRVDNLLSGVLSARSPETTVLLTSDHGNVEESRDRRHTRNPVPLLAVGPLASRFASLNSIMEVTPRLFECLERSPHGIH